MSILYLEGKYKKYNTKLKDTHTNTQCDVVRQKEMIRVCCLQSGEIDQTGRGENSEKTIRQTEENKISARPNPCLDSSGAAAL